jgi:hypothetical protein
MASDQRVSTEKEISAAARAAVSAGRADGDTMRRGPWDIEQLRERQQQRAILGCSR